MSQHSWRSSVEEICPVSSRLVPPVGPKDAKIAIVGESPGKKEVQQGIPFVGPSGNKLDDFLRVCGLDRGEVYITNTVKYYPTSPKKEFFFKGGQPTQAMMEGILELVNELSSLPNLAVAVPCGNEALWALTQERGITKWRGSVMESTLINGLKVIPVMHPAWYFHTQQWLQLIIGEWDWQRIKRESAFKGVVRTLYKC